MDGSVLNIKRILVVYQYIATYRLPIFCELASSEQFQFEFMSGTTGAGETPKLADRRQLEESVFRWIPTTNIWLPGSVLWQSAVVPCVFSRSYDGIIFLGDMHYISTWVGALASRAVGTKIFFWTIGMHRPEFGLKLALRNAWHSLPCHILVYGEYAKNLMCRSGISSNRIAVIGNSLDFKEQSKHYHAVEKLGIPQSDTPMLVAIGRLTERRKLDRLIEAVAILGADGVVTKARIIGQGPERARLEALASELNVRDQVQFVGAIYDEAIIARHMYEADLCVVPGIIGLGAVHAHTYGTPVITCGDWAIQAPEAEVISPGETGGFCAWEDARSVAQAIRVWLSSGRMRHEARHKCRAAVEKKWTPVKQREAIEAAIAPYFERIGSR